MFCYKYKLQFYCTHPKHTLHWRPALPLAKTITAYQDYMDHWLVTGGGQWICEITIVHVYIVTFINLTCSFSFTRKLWNFFASGLLRMNFLLSDTCHANSSGYLIATAKSVTTTITHVTIHVKMRLWQPFNIIISEALFICKHILKSCSLITICNVHNNLLVYV